MGACASTRAGPGDDVDEKVLTSLPVVSKEPHVDAGTPERNIQESMHTVRKARLYAENSVKVEDNDTKAETEAKTSEVKVEVEAESSHLGAALNWVSGYTESLKPKASVSEMVNGYADSLPTIPTKTSVSAMIFGESKEPSMEEVATSITVASVDKALSDVEAEEALKRLHEKALKEEQAQISALVTPTSTLPTVNKAYAPNIYPFPPIAKPQEASQSKDAEQDATEASPFSAALSWVSSNIFFGKKQEGTPPPAARALFTSAAVEEKALDATEDSAPLALDPPPSKQACEESAEEVAASLVKKSVELALSESEDAFNKAEQEATKEQQAQISQMVNPTATLPTVNKAYAPNIYPSPPVFTAEADVQIKTDEVVDEAASKEKPEEEAKPSLPVDDKPVDGTVDKDEETGQVQTLEEEKVDAEKMQKPEVDVKVEAVEVVEKMEKVEKLEKPAETSKKKKKKGNGSVKQVVGGQKIASAA